MIEFNCVIKINNLTSARQLRPTFGQFGTFFKKRTTFSDIQLLLETFPLEQSAKLCLVSKWTSQNAFVSRIPPGCLLIPKVLFNIYTT